MMMRMLKNDLARSRVVSATLLLFILLSSLLTSTALLLAAELSGAVNTLFEKAAAPHFVQMHAGEIDQKAIDAFVASQPQVTAQQTVEMRNIAGRHIFLGSDRSEAESVMENAFVTQNEEFDFLLDLDNEIIRLQAGEIAVPVYYLQRRGLQIGDTVRIDDGDFVCLLRVAAFVRDVQMNPSLVTSKRFVVHRDDWERLKEHLGESEYLIEFLLDDAGKADAFEELYQDSGLPQKDTAITWSLYRLLTALTDGMVIGVILLIALLLMLIALLCLRFTILATLEGEYREIGVMKAIGLPMKTIRGLYMTKYAVLAGTACLLGYLLCQPLSAVLAADITLYMGKAAFSPAHALLPAAGAAAVFLMVCCFCRLMLRRFHHITAVEALHAGSVGLGKASGGWLALHRSGFPGVNIFLGTRDVLGHPGRYGVLGLVFVLCSFLMILPLNLYTTVSAPQFTNYMGAARSDIRIDLARTGEVAAEYAHLLDTVERDADIEKYAALVTASYKVENDGGWERIKVETGDFSVFALEYLAGTAPAAEGEIALSVMQADALEKAVGDAVTLQVAQQERRLTVCGVYQDVTNGGKTAKAQLPWRNEDVLWYVLQADVAQGVDVPEKIAEYGAAFPSARVMDMQQYLHQTLGGTIDRLLSATALAFLTAVLVAACITALFLRMLLAKDAREVAVMKSLGFRARDIAVQYCTRTLLVLLLGVVLGTLAVNTLGQEFIGGLGAAIGASSIRFVVRPLFAWIAYPLTLLGAVWITAAAVSRYAVRGACLSGAVE